MVLTYSALKRTAGAPLKASNPETAFYESLQQVIDGLKSVRETTLNFPRRDGDFNFSWELKKITDGIDDAHKVLKQYRAMTKPVSDVQKYLDALTSILTGLDEMGALFKGAKEQLSPKKRTPLSELMNNLMIARENLINHWKTMGNPLPVCVKDEVERDRKRMRHSI